MHMHVLLFVLHCAYHLGPPLPQPVGLPFYLVLSFQQGKDVQVAFFNHGGQIPSCQFAAPRFVRDVRSAHHLLCFDRMQFCRFAIIQDIETVMASYAQIALQTQDCLQHIDVFNSVQGCKYLHVFTCPLHSITFIHVYVLICVEHLQPFAFTKTNAHISMYILCIYGYFSCQLYNVYPHTFVVIPATEDC